MTANVPSEDSADEGNAPGAEPARAVPEGGGSDTKSNKMPTQEAGKNSAAQTLKAEKARNDQTQSSGIAGTAQFVSESLIELRKITWPDRQQVIKETLSVIVLVAVITACVLAFDYGIAKVVFEPLDKLARHLGGGIGVHH